MGGGRTTKLPCGYTIATRRNNTDLKKKIRYFRMIFWRFRSNFLKKIWSLWYSARNLEMTFQDFWRRTIRNDRFSKKPCWQWLEEGDPAAPNGLIVHPKPQISIVFPSSWLFGCQNEHYQFVPNSSSRPKWPDCRIPKMWNSEFHEISLHKIFWFHINFVL